MYYLLNNTGNIPFKINKVLLNYILSDGGRLLTRAILLVLKLMNKAVNILKINISLCKVNTSIKSIY